MTPTLTPKREAFAAGLAEGLSKAEAYRRAFPRSQGWTDQAVHNRASELSADSGVQGRLADLQAKAAAANEFTAARHLETLAELRDEARQAGQFGPAIKAEEARGKCAGFYTEKIVHTGPNGGPLENVTRIEIVAKVAKVDDDRAG